MSAAVEIRGEQWRIVARFLVAAGVVLGAAALWFRRAEPDLFLITASVLAVSITGGLLAAKRPDNALLWLLAVGPTLLVAGIVASSFAEPVSSRGNATVVDLLEGLLFFGVLTGSLLLFPAYFPDGRVLSDRWRWLPRAAFLVVALTVVWALYDEKNDASAFDPYLGFGTRPGGDALWNVFGPAVFAFGIGVFLAGVVSLVLRYRRGDAVLRKQMRVPFVFFSMWAGLFAAVGVFVKDTNAGEVWSLVMTGILPALLAASIAVAVTRYGLYEIDRIINRTLVYAIVVALLGLIFALGTLWIPSRLPFEDSSLAVAASTLAVAALFNPLRKRTQRFVDRRFYRSRYDAQLVFDEFSTRLRDQVDPDEVAAEWAGVVQRTLQPSSVSWWVREGS